MLKSLKNILNNQNSQENSNDNKDLELLCGLMIETAYTDGKIDAIELNKIKLSLTEIFSEDPKEVDLVLKKAEENKNNSKSLYYYTSFINKNFDKKKKILLIETLWEIVLSDGEVHDFESSIIRRLAGLLYISDIDSGNAKKKALNKIKK